MFRHLISPIPCILLPFVAVCMCCAVLIAGVAQYIQAKQTPTPIADISRPEEVSGETLAKLQQISPPANDPLELARRLKGLGTISPTVEPPAAAFQVGDKQVFWITDQDTNENSQVEAVLSYVTDHVYFWIQEGIQYDVGDLRSLVEAFETTIYPTNRKFFGSEWTPGVDGDVHLYMLYTRGLGSYAAGYFSTADEYPPEAHPYSNAHEMFMLSADNQSLDDEFTYGVLAHEFQHMIHWNLDRNEETWLNEGFSELAALLNGYYEGGFDSRYAQNPDIQLTDWPDDDNATIAHYGGSFLFVAYFLDRFGNQATQALASDPANGMDSLDEVLQTLEATDPLSGEPVRADDVFGDWVLASYIQDASVSDGRYAYRMYEDAPSPKATEKISRCPSQLASRSVNQYGVDYIRITCQGNYTLHFEGSTLAKLIPQEAHSGSYAFYSNRGDMIDTTLTRTFDFTGQSGPLTLSYWTWYSLEKGFDYAYLEASTDGESWTILPTPACTSQDLSGNSYGCGYTDLSGGAKQAQWIEQRVDLSRYAGQKVWLRFEYVTDAAVNEDGFLLDDIAIPEIGYTNDFEGNAGGWQADGFARIENVLPQTFRLALIYKGQETRVQYIPLTANMMADIPLHIGGDIDEVILVVSGTTRFTRQTAAYQFIVD
jgi:immune inhibitor A